MIQAVVTRPGCIEFREVAKPRPAEDQVLIQVKRLGICGSDLHVFHGLHPYIQYPVVQGHEASGVVAEVGRAVQDLAAGDLVTFTPQVSCGRCYPCTHGNPHICYVLEVMGFTVEGAAQEYFAVPIGNVFKLSPAISPEHAALIEPVAVAVHALRRGGDVRDKKILVLGAGPIGNLVGQTAKAFGAEAVMITDVNDFKLAKARQCGLDFAVNTNQERLSSALANAFGEDRADMAFECVGSEVTINQAVVNARKGTTLVVVGVFGQKPTTDVGLVQNHELNLMGSLMYQNADYEHAIELITSGRLTLAPMISALFPFKDYPAAYGAIEASNGAMLKVMIVMG